MRNLVKTQISYFVRPMCPSGEAPRGSTGCLENMFWKCPSQMQSEWLKRVQYSLDRSLFREGPLSGLYSASLCEMLIFVALT